MAPQRERYEVVMVRGCSWVHVRQIRKWITYLISILIRLKVYICMYELFHLCQFLFELVNIQRDQLLTVAHALLYTRPFAIHVLILMRMCIPLSLPCTSFFAIAHLYTIMHAYSLLSILVYQCPYLSEAMHMY